MKSIENHLTEFESIDWIKS